MRGWRAPSPKRTGSRAPKILSASCVLRESQNQGLEGGPASVLFLSRKSTWYWVYFLSFRELLCKTVLQSAPRCWFSRGTAAWLGFSAPLCALSHMDPLFSHFANTLASHLNNVKALSYLPPSLPAVNLVAVLFCVKAIVLASWVACGDSNVHRRLWWDSDPCSVWRWGDAHHMYIPWE